MRLSLRSIREGVQAPAWSGPVYFDYLTRSIVYAPIGVHCLLRFGRWSYFVLLRLVHRPRLYDASVEKALVIAEIRGHNAGFRRGANEAQRWIYGAFRHLESK